MLFPGFNGAGYSSRMRVDPPVTTLMPAKATARTAMHEVLGDTDTPVSDRIRHRAAKSLAAAWSARRRRVFALVHHSQPIR